MLVELGLPGEKLDVLEADVEHFGYALARKFTVF